MNAREILDEYQRRVRFEFNTAIEDRVTELLIKGYTVQEMTLDHQLGPKAVLKVRGIPDSEFWIDHEGDSVVVRGKPAQ